MNSALLDISGKIDAAMIAVLEAVDSEASKLNIPYIVVGATARDLVLHYGFGAPITRATKDIDFAVSVSDWHTYTQLKNGLLGRGFRESKFLHRLHKQEAIIDLVPFGGIETTGALIGWPPEEQVTMNVLGFREAAEHAQPVCVRKGPELSIPVVTPCGLALLKIIAWTDRDPALKQKDAKDLAYLLKTYEEIPAIADRAYGDGALLEALDWDLAAAAAYLLGVDTSEIASAESRSVVEGLDEAILTDMSSHARELDRHAILFEAFMDGFQGSLSASPIGPRKTQPRS